MKSSSDKGNSIAGGFRQGYSLVGKKLALNVKKNVEDAKPPLFDSSNPPVSVKPAVDSADSRKKEPSIPLFKA